MIPLDAQSYVGFLELKNHARRQVRLLSQHVNWMMTVHVALDFRDPAAGVIPRSSPGPLLVCVHHERDCQRQHHPCPVRRHDERIFAPSATEITHAVVTRDQTTQNGEGRGKKESEMVEAIRPSCATVAISNPLVSDHGRIITVNFNGIIFKEDQA